MKKDLSLHFGNLLSSNTTFFEQQEPITLLWLLRALIPLGGINNFIHRSGFSDDNVALALGLKLELSSGQDSDEEEDDDDEFEFLDHNPALFKKVQTQAITKLYQKFERKASKITLPEKVLHNIKQLNKLTNLTEVEQKILAFAIMLTNESILSEGIDTIGSVTSSRARSVIATLLKIPLPDVQAALSETAFLSQSGLMRLESGSSNFFSSKITVVSSDFADKFADSLLTPELILNSIAAPAPAAKLTLADYPHLSDDIGDVCAILSNTMTQKREGCNVLLYGPPGTGKTELVRAISAHLNTNLFEIVCHDESGSLADGARRLQIYQAAQHFFKQQKAFILFDEIEDVFKGNSRFSSYAQRSKGATNLMLEKNSLPTFWISNDISTMDPAFIRRFDAIIEAPIPPKEQRKQIITNACASLCLEDDRLERISLHEDLSPAVMERSARNALSCTEPNESRTAMFERRLNATLKAQGHPIIASKLNAAALPSYYDPALIHAKDGNASIDLTLLATRIQSVGAARICLYGPPGTGKTAYGHYLSKVTGKKLMIKKASDLLSMFVGGTEKSLADAFESAKRDDAILLIDEVDSFLQDRRNAQRSWEVTAVNEMLTQMESFSGIFIASTNLIEGLDQAALRRFDFKAYFGYLQAEQAWSLFCQQCSHFGFSATAPNLEQQVKALTTLTPGDFAAVTRRHRFNPLSDAMALFQSLQSECNFKEDTPKNRIGFL